jgi:hypothetical protein
MLTDFGEDDYVFGVRNSMRCRNFMRFSRTYLFVLLMTIATTGRTLAEDAAPASPMFGSGKLLATAGVIQLEGAGGGGIATWALISGYETPDSVGANVHYTYVYLPDFALHSTGLTVGFFDRFEVSYARQWFDTQAAGGRLGLGSGFEFHQDILGAKIRLVGDAVYDQDKLLPQLAIGAQYKANDRSAVLRAIGARNSDGVDFYLAASKLFLSESLLVNATIRATRANQFGILGFGGDRNNGYTAQFEGAAALLLSRQLAVGAEYRTKPNNLGFAKENNAFDFFLAYFLNKNLSATVAFVDLGDIALQKNQNGVYVSLQAGF